MSKKIILSDLVPVRDRITLHARDFAEDLKRAREHPDWDTPGSVLAPIISLICVKENLVHSKIISPPF